MSAVRITCYQRQPLSQGYNEPDIEVRMRLPYTIRFAATAMVCVAALSAATPATPGSPIDPTSKPRTSANGPGIIPIGSSVTFNFTNAPDTYTLTTTFSSTPIVVDNGAVKIWQEQVPTGSTGEWDVFYMETVNGGPLANNIDADWEIELAYDLSQAAIFDGSVLQWAVSGTPVSPLTNGIGSICCAATTNPILAGAAYYNPGSGSVLSAGVQSDWQEVYVDPYSLVTSGGVDPSTANQFTFALHFTLPQPLPVITGVVSASAFGEFPTFAPGSWIEIYGTNLATITRSWTGSDFSGVNGPTSLSDTSVTIGGQSAFVDYISPLQVNVQVPGGVTAGTQQLILTTEAGASAPFQVTVDTTMPGLLAPANFKIDGIQYMTAQFADGTYVLPTGAIASLTSQPAQPGDTIVIYGIGFGQVTPNIPPGQLVEESNTLAAPFTISFGGTAATTVPYDGLASTYMGLYQFNVVVPSVPANSATPVTFTLGGVSGTQTLAIAIGN
jgi:uncharacterized protein (TIGR03437 family)